MSLHISGSSNYRQNVCLLAGWFVIDEKAEILHTWKIQVYTYARSSNCAKFMLFGYIDETAEILHSWKIQVYICAEHVPRLQTSACYKAPRCERSMCAPILSKEQGTQGDIEALLTFPYRDWGPPLHNHCWKESLRLREMKCEIGGGWSLVRVLRDPVVPSQVR